MNYQEIKEALGLKVDSGKFEVYSPVDGGVITKIALEEGLIETGGKTPHATMAAQIYTDLQQKGEKSSIFFCKTTNLSLNT